MRKKDLEKQLEEIEMRRLSGLLSQEEAIIAKQKLIQQNKETVTDMKAQVESAILYFFPVFCNCCFSVYAPHNYAINKRSGVYLAT
jgi:hypothetical protein